MERKQYNCIETLQSEKIKVNFLESNYINYNSVPSLENIALLSVATELSKLPEIRSLIGKNRFNIIFISESGLNCHSEKMLEYLEKNITNKLISLPLPESLKAKVSSIFRPINIQMLELIRYDLQDMEHFNSIHWTSVGTVDPEKTLEQLIQKYSDQYAKRLYRLACHNCLEDSISHLWGKLTKSEQQFYLKECLEYDLHLVRYWTSVITKEFSEFHKIIKENDLENIYDSEQSIYRNMFTLTLFEGNMIAAKYFWNKLSAEEIICSLPNWLNDAVHRRKNYDRGYQYTNKYADLFYFLLSKQNVEQQREAIQQNIEVVLNSLFNDWPWQRFLLPTVRSVSDSLDEEVYVKLLLKIISQIKQSKTAEKLLRELWYGSSENVKKCFIQYIINDQNCSADDVVSNLLAVEDMKAILEILKYANVDEKKRIVFLGVENYEPFAQIYADKHYVFHKLIEKSFTSESDIKSLKRNIIREVGSDLCCVWLLQNNWKVVEMFLNWSLTSQGQIQNFKNNILDKKKITFQLLEKCEFEEANKFLKWCFCSEQEINHFKKEFAMSKLEIVKVFVTDWCLFEKFLGWCFISEQEIREFKFYVVQSNKMPDIIYQSIGYAYNFEFVDKFINWCFQSPEEMKQFKVRFALSETFSDLLENLVSGCDSLHNRRYNCKPIPKLIKMFSPLDEKEKCKLKENITALYDSCWIFPDISKESIFHLLDDETFNI